MYRLQAEIPEILKKEKLEEGLGKVFAIYATEKAEAKFDGDAHKALRQAIALQKNPITFKKEDSNEEIVKNLKALTACFPADMQKEIEEAFNAAFDAKDADEIIRLAKAFHDNLQVVAASAYESQLKEFEAAEAARLSALVPPTSPTPTPVALVPPVPLVAPPNPALAATTTTTVSTGLLASAQSVTKALNPPGSLVNPSTGTTSFSSPNTFLPQHNATKTPTTGNMSGVGAVSEAEWSAIKTKIKKIYTAAKVNHSPDGNTIRVTDPEHSISRDANGVSVSSTANPPDIGAMVKSFKATGKTECEIGASPGPETTAQLIIELQNPPNPVKPNITNKKILEDLEAKAATHPDSKRALEIYQKITAENATNSTKAKPS